MLLPAAEILQNLKKDLADLIAEGEDIEVNCDFCNSKYVFKTDELKEALGGED